MAASTEKKSKSRKKSAKATAKQLSTLLGQLESDRRDSLEAFANWSDYLRNRKSPIGLDKLVGTKPGNALKWELPADLFDGVDVSVDAILDTTQNPSAKISTWLDDASQRPVGPAYALQCLAWVHSLPDLVSTVPGTLWWQLFDFLSNTPAEFTTIGRADLWTSQLIGGEIPMAVAYLFPELPHSSPLGKAASRFLSESMEDIFDGAGMLPGHELESVRRLLACWTRCGHMAKETKGAKLSPSAREQYDWFVRNALRLTRADRYTAFSPTTKSARPIPDLFPAALSLTKDDEDRALAKWVLEEGRDKTSVWREPASLPAEPAYQSDWSEVAVLQPGWAPGSPRLVVDYSQQRVRLELAARGKVALSGQWGAEWVIGGAVTGQTTDWECCCWHTDEDVDLFELECELDNGWKWQRQFLLAREDQFILMADILIADDATGRPDEDIQYSGMLPMPDSVDFEVAEETRDGYLRASKRLCLVLPLALPEWKIDRHVGELKTEAGALILRQSARGSGLYAPLFMDLHPRRLRREATWRQLTVGENLEVVPAHVAVGYRAQVRTEQWLFYRSLSKPSNRTILGHNIMGEFLAARILDDGSSEELIQVSSGVP